MDYDIGLETGLTDDQIARSIKSGDITKIGQLFRESNNTMQYIVAGDSTRSNLFNGMLAYYSKQLAKVDVIPVDQAKSGLSGRGWIDGTDPDKNITKTLELIDGTGNNSILEYSFGINDVQAITLDQRKLVLTDAIDLLLAQKPELTILLVSPVGTYVQRAGWIDAYTEVAAEYDLKLINGSDCTDSVVGNPDYYQDATHPNINGSKRVVNFIMSNILPADLQNIMTMEDEKPSAAPPISGVSAEIGLWSTSDGSPNPNSAWRRLTEVAVEPNFTLVIDHGGERYNCVFLDESGVFINESISNDVGNGNAREIVVPQGAYKLRANITADGANWDLLSYPVSVQYKATETPYMKQRDINSGLKIKLGLLEDQFLDSNGNKPEAGQTPVGNADGTWTWG